MNRRAPGNDSEPVQILFVGESGRYRSALTTLQRLDEELRILDAIAVEDLHRMLDAGSGVDAVVADLESIDAAGRDVVETVHEHDPDLPVLLLGGDHVSDQQQLERGLDGHEVHQVASPSPATILDRLGRAVGHSLARSDDESDSGPLPALVAAAPVAIVVVDGSGRIDFANPAIADVLGYHPDELVGESLTTVLADRDAPQNLDAFIEYLAAVEESPTREYVEVTGQHAAGHELRLGLSFGGFRHDGRQYFVVTVRDRTDLDVGRHRRAAERELLSNRLTRQERLVGELMGVTRALVTSETRTRLETAVCRTLAQSDRIAFAWIGATEGEAIEVRASAGDDQGYLETVPHRPVDDVEPAMTTARTRTPTVVDDIETLTDRGSWAEAAWARGIRSVASVPLLDGDRCRGVLTVYALEVDAFDEFDRRVLERIAEMTAFGSGALERERALLADTVVELRLDLVGGEDVFSRLARDTGGTVVLDGVVAREGSLLLYLEVTDAQPDSVVSSLEADPEILEVATVDGEMTDRFEVVVDDDPLLTRLVRGGAKLRTVSAAPEGTTVQVSLPVDGDVRNVIRSLERVYEEVSLRSRTERPKEFVEERGIRSELESRLTDRQLEVLQTAFFSGYFEWPRERTSEEVASSLDISQPTFNHHLRIAERKLLSILLASEQDRDTA